MISHREKKKEKKKRVMGDKKLISSSSSSTSIYDTRNNHHHHHPPSSSDEISQFLRHIFDRSSPLPSYYSPATTTTVASTAIGVHGDPHAENPRCFVSQTPSSDSPLLSKRAAEFSEVLIGSAVGSGSAAAACFGFSGGDNNNNAQGNSSGTRVSSSSVGASGNETDEYDCESEVLEISLSLKVIFSFPRKMFYRDFLYNGSVLFPPLKMSKKFHNLGFVPIAIKFGCFFVIMHTKCLLICLNEKKKQEGVEAVVDEAPSKSSGPSRSSSKRCRAAEVHNLSEKVRSFSCVYCQKSFDFV